MMTTMAAPASSFFLCANISPKNDMLHQQHVLGLDVLQFRLPGPGRLVVDFRILAPQGVQAGYVILAFLSQLVNLARLRNIQVLLLR